MENIWISYRLVTENTCSIVNEDRYIFLILVILEK